MPNLVLSAAQGIDTEDFLNHIAWTDIIYPNLLKQKEILSSKLVGSVLRQLAPNEETREQLAGKILGLDYTIKLITELVHQGRKAQEELALQGLHIQQ